MRTPAPCRARSPRRAAAGPEKPAAASKRMAECVAEIEQCALAGLALVARDDARLGAAAHCDRRVRALCACRRRTFRANSLPATRRNRHRRATRISRPRRSRRRTALRQRVEQARCPRPPGRLVEGADQILADANRSPVLPRSRRLTCASSVVGTCTKSTPRRTIAAASRPDRRSRRRRVPRSDRRARCGPRSPPRKLFGGVQTKFSNLRRPGTTMRVGSMHGVFVRRAIWPPPDDKTAPPSHR